MEGQQLKLKGISRVEGNNQEWLDWIREVAITYSQLHDQVTSDDLRRRADAQGYHPNHPNAWGAVFHGKHWRVVGRCKSKYLSNHAREIKVWRYVG